MSDSMTSRKHNQTDVIGCFDVLCGRNKMVFNNIGNRRFRIIVSLFLTKYVDVKSTRKEKSQIIRNIIEAIKACGGRFLDKRDNTFEELSEQKVYEKVGHAIRDMILSKNLGDDSWMGKRIHETDKLSLGTPMQKISTKPSTFKHQKDQMIGTTITFFSGSNENSEDFIKESYGTNASSINSENVTSINNVEPEILEYQLIENDDFLQANENNVKRHTASSSITITNNDPELNESSSGMDSETTEVSVQGSSTSSQKVIQNEEYLLTPAMFDDDVEIERFVELQDDQAEDDLTVCIQDLLQDIE
jgi:hypothetical protein